MHIPLSKLALAAGILASSTTLVAADASNVQIPMDLPLSSLLSSAQAHLSRGETADALAYYDAAIAKDSNNYLTLFKRATTYLSLGRANQAAVDLEKVLVIKPGFEGAHMQLGKIKARQADWQAAREQYKQAQLKPGNEEYDQLLEAEGAAKLAEQAGEKGDWETCVVQANEAIKVASRALALRELRARCRFERGDMEEAMGDLQHVLQMKPGDTRPHLRIAATSFYGMGDRTQGMNQARKCLQSDPDSKPCSKLLKQQKQMERTLAKVVKALDKGQPVGAARHLVSSTEGEKGLIAEVKDYVAELRKEGHIAEKAPDVLMDQLVELACRAYHEASSKKASEWCPDALSRDPGSLYGLLHQAKSHMDAESFDAAIDTLNKAAEAHPDKKSLVNPLLHKAQIALKRSKSKDYYKVLSVAHDADERQIKSAYRKACKIYHPDKAAAQHLTPEEAQKKMSDVNEAYEVLSDPELRARFDRGDDPNNPQGGPAQGGNPFHGSHPFFQNGGGGQQFNVKFSQGGGGGGFGGFPFGM